MLCFCGMKDLRIRVRRYIQVKRAGFGQGYYEKYAGGFGGGTASKGDDRCVLSLYGEGDGNRSEYPPWSRD